MIPVPTPDEVPDSELSKVRLLTNRAPVVLAFATELLRYTMPEQPPSARLSLAQAVVSANSRSKAVSIGIAQSSAEQEGYGEGQPVVRVMGREIRVLKRGGYDWKGDERRGEEEGWAGEVDLATRNEMERRAREERDRREAEELQRSQSQESATLTEPSQQQPSQPAVASWSTSPTLSLKASTFVGRATTFAVSPGTSATAAATALVRRLLETNPHLQTATHNAWAYRCVNPNLRSSSSAASRILEDSFDDGETGAGALLLRVLRDAGVEDALVLMTRWWGGIFLGPDRFRLMRTVAVEALAARNRVVSGGGDGGGGAVGLGLPGGEALWGLDLEAMRSAAKAPAQHASRGREDIVRTGLGDMHIHRPEPARAYLMKSFASAPSPDVPATGDGQSTKLAAKKKTPRELEAEAAHNASLLTAALRRLFDSWADHVTADELDRRAWQWYIAVRPDVADGRAGWGAKGVLDLGRILALRRSE